MRNLIHKIGTNSEAKTIGENIISLSIIHLCSYLFSLITIPYLTRVIGANCFGLLAFSTTVISYFQTITDWGFQLSAVRDVAQNRNEKRKVSDIFSNVMNCRLLLMAFCYIVLSLLIYFIPNFRSSALVLYLTSLILPGFVFFPTWFFQGIERMKYITIFNFIFKLIFTILIFVVIRKQEDYILQPVLLAVGTFVVGVISIYLIVYKWGYRWHLTSYKEIVSTLKDSFDIFVNTILPQFYNSFSQILLMAWSGPVACGIYAAADKFNALMVQAIRVLSGAFFPYLARKIERHTFYSTIYLTTSFCGFAFLLIASPLLVYIFLTDEFEDAILIMRILSFSLLFTALQNVWGTNYLILLHYDRIVRNVNIFGSIFGFIISFPLVFNWGVVGVALTVTLTNMIIGVTLFYMGYHTKCKLKFKK